MKLIIDTEACKKSNIDLRKVLLMIYLHNDGVYEEDLKDLIDKGLISKDLFKESHWVSPKGTTILNSVLLNSDDSVPKEDSLEELAIRLKEIFPKGKKEGTNLYWAEGKQLIIRRLRMFFKKYEEKYSHEQIIQAAENYVNNFNGNYQYMRVLKYFLFKENNEGGSSDLINYVENADENDNLRNDWTTTVI